MGYRLSYKLELISCLP